MSTSPPSPRVRRRAGASRRLRALVVRGPRGPQCTRLVFIDDATSQLMQLQFVQSESTFAYFHGRALHALNIDIICANSSQAKGRVERAPKTLQDRLVKELRLAGVATLAAGNALLPAFTAHYNARFVKPPAHEKDLHRPLRAGDDLEDAFAWKDERTLSQALTTAIRQGDLHPGAERAGQGGDRQAGNRHRLSRWPAGDPSQEPAPAKTGGVELAYRTFDKMRQGRS